MVENKNIKKLIDKIVEGYTPTSAELVRLLSLEKQNSTLLFDAANHVAGKIFNKRIEVRGIIEFSNRCRCSCAYCGLRKENQSLQRYRMSVPEIIDNAKEAYHGGFKTVVLQSGEDPWYTTDSISAIIKGIKKGTNLTITLSVGERDVKDFQQWYKDGATRYLMKHETADQGLYKQLHPYSSFQKRITLIKALKEIGYQTGSGFMIGLPGQSIDSIANDILLLKELQVSMAGIGPFIPHPCTPLANLENGNDFLTLKALAITRIFLKTIHLPATTALKTVNQNSYQKAFHCGANVLMQKVEPDHYQNLYNIYPTNLGQEHNQNNECQSVSLKEMVMEIEEFIKKLGRKMSTVSGDSFYTGGDNND